LCSRQIIYFEGLYVNSYSHKDEHKIFSYVEEHLLHRQVEWKGSRNKTFLTFHEQCTKWESLSQNIILQSFKSLCSESCIIPKYDMVYNMMKRKRLQKASPSLARVNENAQHVMLQFPMASFVGTITYFDFTYLQWLI